MAAFLLFGVMIGTVAFVCTVNYAQRARKMVENGSEQAWAVPTSSRLNVEQELLVHGAPSTSSTHLPIDSART